MSTQFYLAILCTKLKLTGCPSLTANDLTNPGMGAITIVETSRVTFSGMYVKYLATSDNKISVLYYKIKITFSSLMIQLVNIQLAVPANIKM